MAVPVIDPGVPGVLPVHPLSSYPGGGPMAWTGLLIDGILGPGFAPGS
jgi:hypothetical protein